MNKTAAVILAGGRGKRMDILCHLRPKPALPFAGRFKVIDFTLSNCLYSGINDIAILTDYQRSHMAQYLGQWGRANPIGTFHVLEPETGSYQGTADAVYQNLSYLDNFNVGNVLILAGDHIYKMEYREMLAFHERMKADVTVGVIRVPIEDAHRFGTVSLGEDGEIVDFVEKSRNPKSNLASMGIYVFNRDVLFNRLKEDARWADSSHDFGYAILPNMVGGDKVNAYEFTGYWQDIGTPQAYYAANMELICAQPSFSLNHSRTVLTQCLNLPPPGISRQGKVVNSLLSPGCVIKGRVENSVLSPQVWVDEDAVVRNSVIMGSTFIGRHSVIDRCVLDEEVKVGDYCYLGFGSSLIPDDWDITVLGKGVTVPPHTAIGRNCKIMPHVETSDFVTNVVTSGAILSKRLLTSFQKERVTVGES